jgi:hypothetical protein
MKYKITNSYHWYYIKTEKFIVKMYFINGVPFTFDEVSDNEQTGGYITTEITNNRIYSSEDLYKTSFYLIDEECHPLLFDLDLLNPDQLPKT